MHTLHEFFVATKATEYLITVAFFIVFPVYWILLSKKKKSMKQKTKNVHHQYWR